MKIPCLSVLQPLADDIINGLKIVENRGWTWLKDRDWATEGPILIGFQSSTNKGMWNSFSEDDQKVVCESSQTGEPEFGRVIGVVQVVNICRPKDLPAKLKNDPYVYKNRSNWCWVLKNPEWLTKSVKATGQARLFYANIPDRLISTKSLALAKKNQEAKTKTAQ
jgi:hypothetical protein